MSGSRNSEDFNKTLSELQATLLGIADKLPNDVAAKLKEIIENMLRTSNSLNEQLAKMRQNYLGGNYGYGHAKQTLFELIIENYKQEREAFNNYMSNPELLEEKLMAGEEKARAIGRKVLSRVKKTLGYN